MGHMRALFSVQWVRKIHSTLYFSTVDAWNECTTQSIYLLYNLSVEQRFRGKLNEISSRNNYGAHANFVWRAMGKRKKRHSTMFFFQPVFGMGVPIHSRNIFFSFDWLLPLSWEIKWGILPEHPIERLPLFQEKNIYQYLICPKVFLKQYNIVKVIQVSCVRLKFQNAKPL